MEKKNEPIMFCAVGMCYFGMENVLTAGMEVTLVKEHDNEYDNEAILVKLPGIGKVAHVANSHRTAIGDTYSAGRLYDKFDEEAKGIVRIANLNGPVICEFIR